MQTLHLKATVQPGHRIEIADPALAVGAVVDVTVLTGAADPAAVTADPPAQAPAASVLAVVEGLRGRRRFQSAGEVDAYLTAVRNSWDR